MREWTEKHIRELVDDEFKRFKHPDPSPTPTPVPIGSNIISFQNLFGIGWRQLGYDPYYWDSLVNEGYMINWIEYLGDVVYDKINWSRYRWVRYVNGNPITKQLPPLREQKAIRYNGQVVPLLGFMLSTNFSPALPAVLGYGTAQTNVFAMKDGLKFPVLNFACKKQFDNILAIPDQTFPEIIQYDPSNTNRISSIVQSEYFIQMFTIDPRELDGYDHWTYAQGTVYNCELYFDVYKSSAR